MFLNRISSNFSLEAWRCRRTNQTSRFEKNSPRLWRERFLLESFGRLFFLRLFSTCSGWYPLLPSSRSSRRPPSSTLLRLIFSAWLSAGRVSFFLLDRALSRLPMAGTPCLSTPKTEWKRRKENGTTVKTEGRKSARKKGDNLLADAFRLFATVHLFVFLFIYICILTKLIS